MTTAIGFFDDVNNSDDGVWLMEQLRQSLEDSVHHITRVAAIVRRLEELDIPVTLKIGPMPFLRKIAYGNMSPQLYVRYEGRRLLLDKISSLPTPDQERLAEANATVKVMGLNGDHRIVPVESLTSAEIKQVFASGRMRDDAEQVGHLRETLQRKSQDDPETPTVRTDRKRKGISVSGPAFISLIEMKHYVSQLENRRR